MADYFTDAPVFVVRGIAAYFGCGFYPAGIGEPAWSSTVLEGRGGALNRTINALVVQGYRVERESSVMSNPTYALAAASITREGGSSPAAAWTR